MAVEIKLPKLSDTMEEGTLLRWLKNIGDPIKVGDVIAEVETDKADMELEAEATGTLQETKVQAGDAVQVGSVLAILSQVDETTGDQQGDESPAVEPAPPAKNVSEASPKTEAPASSATPPPGKGSRLVPPPRSSPARSKSASGALESTEESAEDSPSVPPTKTEAPPPSAPQTSRLRAAVAKQMVASKRDVPHFYVTSEIDMSEAARMRESLSETPMFPERLTFTHIILRALALTLPRHPRVNAAWSDEGVMLYRHVHLGIAVAVEDGLLAPVLRDCQDRSLRNLARAATQLVEKAKTGRSDKLTGATFTLSNLGMLDVDELSAVITPPQAGILAVGSIRERAVVRDGKLAIAKTMRATLSADHRVLTGYEAGRFLTELKQLLETPALLLLGEESEGAG